MIRVTDALQVDERDVDERFVRASGPGGQNVNKVATAVELRFNVAASSLPHEVKERLRALAGARMSADGVLMIDSREHRLQSQNRAAARARLAELIRQALIQPGNHLFDLQCRAARRVLFSRMMLLFYECFVFGKPGEKLRGEIKKHRRGRASDDE